MRLVYLLILLLRACSHLLFATSDRNLCNTEQLLTVQLLSVILQYFQMCMMNFRDLQLFVIFREIEVLQILDFSFVISMINSQNWQTHVTTLHWIDWDCDSLGISPKLAWKNSGCCFGNTWKNNYAFAFGGWFLTFEFKWNFSNGILLMPKYVFVFSISANHLKAEHTVNVS